MQRGARQGASNRSCRYSSTFISIITYSCGGSLFSWNITRSPVAVPSSISASATFRFIDIGGQLNEGIGPWVILTLASRHRSV